MKSWLADCLTWIDGNFHSLDVSDFTNSGTPYPQGFTMDQNYPNPFNQKTTIGYTLPSTANVTITVYNILKQEVTTLTDDYQAAGTGYVIWDGIDYSGKVISGSMYLYHLQAGNFSKTMKMVLLKLSLPGNRILRQVDTPAEYENVENDQERPDNNHRDISIQRSPMTIF